MQALATALTSSSKERFADELYILDKSDRLVKFEQNKVQADYARRRGRRNLILKARQQGLSTFIQADQFLDAVTSTMRCATLAHDNKGTSYLRSMAKRFWQNLPDGMRPTRTLDNATTTLYANTGSEVTILTAGSGDLGRGGTNRRLHGSEVAFWPDADATMAGVMQTVPPDGMIELESTPNGAQGFFYDKCMEALDGNSDWQLFFYPWWWSDEYRLDVDLALPLTDDEQRLMREHGLDVQQIAWRRAKQRELGRLFLQEYPEDPRTCFITSGNGYFSDIEDLDDVFTAPLGMKADGGHKYSAGLDFAQTTDFTVLSVVDESTLAEVELLRMNQLAWSDMRGRVAQACKRWNVRVLEAEANSMGSTNIEELNKELSAIGVSTRVHSFKTTAQSKPPLIIGLHYALDEGGLRLLSDSAGRHEINTFAALQAPSGGWKYEAANGGHDDTVIARALAWRAVSRVVSVATTMKR